MTTSLKPMQIVSAPGIKRDGTEFDSKHYLDGEWVRFQRGLPRKMGGYQSVTSLLEEKVYGMRVDAVGQNIYVHMGTASYLLQAVLDQNGTLIQVNDRTPAGLTTNANRLWMFDTFYDSASGTFQLIAHAGINLSTISNQTEYSIYSGSLTGAGAVVATSLDPVSGGILSLNPYLMAYGTNGRVDWTAASDLSTTLDSAFVAGSKIVKGLPLRGTGGGPGAILWSLDEVIRAQFYDPTIQTFAFDTLSSESSVLSSQGFVDYDGTQYWVGIDRFLQFNGVVQEVPNQMNINWFFKNLNFAQRQKVFAYKVPRFGEIWWCFPYGDAVDCTHAVILNIREKCWYDTELPATMRTAGAFAKVYQRPFMCDAVVQDSTSKYTLWQHEVGVDEVVGSAINAIKSRIRSSEFSLIGDAAQDMGFHIGRVEPDFVQSGSLKLRVHERANARSSVILSPDKTIPEVPTTPQEQVVNLSESTRVFSVEFESNEAGGDFQMGKVLGFVQPQGTRVTQ